MFTLYLLIVFSLFIMLYVFLLLPFLWWNKDVYIAVATHTAIVQIPRILIMLWVRCTANWQQNRIEIGTHSSLLQQWRHCHAKSTASRGVLTLCLPCVALPWGQPAWQGLGFSGLVHEETHPCGSNFIQSVFKTVQTRCIDSVLSVKRSRDITRYMIFTALKHIMQFRRIWCAMRF